MKKIKKLLWFVIVLLVIISVGLVVRRMLILTHLIPAIPAGARFGFETGLKDYPVLTLVHITPGLLFVLLGPALLRTEKGCLVSRRYRVFAWIFICSAGIIGLSAVTMPFITMPVGGINEAAAAILFGCIFLLETTQTLNALLRNNSIAYHDWLRRTVALGLAIASTRPVMVLAFVICKVSPQVFLGTAFWIAFTIHLCVAETWIYYSSTTQKKQGR